MKINFLSLVLLLLSFGSWAQDIPEKPNPPRLVNDFVGGLLSESQIQALENKLVAYNDSTSTQIAVVIIKSTQPYDIADYALQLGRKWGVGQQGKNNGIVFLWAPGDRKITIQTGYGMEGALPDIYANRIIKNIVIPHFQNIEYYQGIDLAIDEIIKYASGEYQAEATEEEFPIGIIVLVFFLFILFVIIASKNKGNGGGNGGRTIYNDPTWPYTTYTGWGRQSGHWGGGGFGGGFGGRGGGFGGFGGGSFGGGGASGSY